MDSVFEDRSFEDHKDPAEENKEDKKEGENKDKKTRKQIKPRFKFTIDHLTNRKTGLRLFYEATKGMKLLNKPDVKEVDLLNQFIRLYKEWHFKLVPKYDLNYFISKCQDFGRDPALRTYLQRMRKVHTGDNKWEDFEEDEEEVVTQQQQQQQQTPLTNTPAASQRFLNTPNQPKSSFNSIQNTLQKYITQHGPSTSMKHQSPKPNDQSGTNLNGMKSPQANNINRGINQNLSRQNDLNTKFPNNTLNTPNANNNNQTAQSPDGFYEERDLGEDIVPDIPVEYYADNFDNLDDLIEPDDFEFPIDEMEEEPIQHETKKVKKNENPH